MKSGFFPICYADDGGDMMTQRTDEGIFSVAYFTSDEFVELFQMSDNQVRKWFAERKKDQTGFDHGAGWPLGPNNEENFALWQNFSEEPWEVEVFTFNEKRGQFPDRFQDREDITDWLREVLDPDHSTLTNGYHAMGREEKLLLNERLEEVCPDFENILYDCDSISESFGGCTFFVDQSEAKKINLKICLGFDNVEEFHFFELSSVNSKIMQTSFFLELEIILSEFGLLLENVNVSFDKYLIT